MFDAQSSNDFCISCLQQLGVIDNVWSLTPEPNSVEVNIRLGEILKV